MYAGAPAVRSGSGLGGSGFGGHWNEHCQPGGAGVAGDGGGRVKLRLEALRMRARRSTRGRIRIICLLRDSVSGAILFEGIIRGDYSRAAVRSKACEINRHGLKPEAPINQCRGDTRQTCWVYYSRVVATPVYISLGF